jgi:bifunctional lysine-specific demethylase and histidyl-hydroxylase NO66
LGDHPALRRCVRVAPEEFATGYWGQRPLLSAAGTLPSAYSDLFSVEAVDELVSSRGVRTPFIRMARDGEVLAASRFTAPGGFGAGIADQVSSEKVLAEFAAGATIVLQGLHRLWPPLIEFSRQLVADLSHPAQVNAYVTPASSRGFDPHYDVHDVFVLQISGEKRWVIHEPVHAQPLRDQPWADHKAAVRRRAQDAPVIDTVLRPGDALYLPRGWLHSATALGGTTIHLTVGVEPFNRYDLVETLLQAAQSDPLLRSSLPIGIDLADPDAVAPHLEATVKQLVEALAAIEPDAVARRLARKLADATRPAPVRPLATVALAETLERGQRIVWRPSLRADVARRDADTFTLAAQTKSVQLPLDCEAGVSALLAGGTYRVDELPGIPVDDALALVRRLLREGFVVAADE